MFAWISYLFPLLPMKRQVNSSTLELRIWKRSWFLVKIFSRVLISNFNVFKHAMTTFGRQNAFGALRTLCVCKDFNVYVTLTYDNVPHSTSSIQFSFLLSYFLFLFIFNIFRCLCNCVSVSARRKRSKLQSATNNP